jgi:hypothetical protein
LSGGGEPSLLRVATLSHQWRHPDGLPSLSVSDGRERSLIVRRGEERTALGNAAGDALDPR